MAKRSRARSECPHCRGPHRKGAHRTKVGKVMHEYKRGQLHSGSKRGPVVRKRKQAIAIALSEARRARRKRRR